MADYVHDEYPELVCGISYVRYTGDRESLHLQKDRGNATLEKNYFFKEDLAGKEVLVVDDILTTGYSLQDFRKEVTTMQLIHELSWHFCRRDIQNAQCFLVLFGSVRLVGR